MDDNNIPAFETWTREDLNKLAYTMHKQLIDVVERSAKLRLALREAKQELSNYKDDWK